jgi:hypothetical protein
VARTAAHGDIGGDGLLKEQPASGPKMIWQVKDVGSGFSTPSVGG